MFAHQANTSSSLETRVDTDFFFTSDDYTFDLSPFALMVSIVNNLFDRGCLAYHKFLRYNQSRADNPNFYFGPKAPFFEATAASIFEAFASYGNEGIPDLATVQVMLSRCTGNTQCLLGGNIGKGNPNSMGDFSTAMKNGKLALDLQAVE